jgi:hypothetical protein
MRTLVGGTVASIVAAFDTSARTSWLNELNVVLVAQAHATLRVSLAADATGAVVLPSCVRGIETTQLLRSDAPGHWKPVSTAWQAF